MASFIDAGLPADRDSWPDGVLAAVREIAQGDVVPCPPVAYFGDPQRPVHAVTRRYAATDATPRTMVIGGAAAPQWAIVTSGTCDVGEEDSRRPLRPTVQLSPVVDLSGSDGGTVKMITLGKIQYLVHLPALSSVEEGFWVADLRIEFPVEKGWLASQTILTAFDNESDREKIGKAVARIRERPAMAREYYDHIHGPLGDRLTETYKSNRELADAIDEQIVEWGVQVDSRLQPQRVEVVLLGGDAPIDDRVQEWWRAAVDQLRPRATAASISILGPRFASLDEMSVSEYRKLTILPSPSRRLSPS